MGSCKAQCSLHHVLKFLFNGFEFFRTKLSGLNWHRGTLCCFDNKTLFRLHVPLHVHFVCVLLTFWLLREGLLSFRISLYWQFSAKTVSREIWLCWLTERRCLIVPSIKRLCRISGKRLKCAKKSEPMRKVFTSAITNGYRKMWNPAVVVFVYK